LFFVNILKNINFKKGAIVNSDGTVKEHLFDLLFIKKYELPALTYFRYLSVFSLVIHGSYP